ncbi:radical SAM superfamily enzyme YgiQ (UPF0313 family) [Methanolinea mesophila]|uniref:B12-binding domain-containing radical SAM protein n=1 Tax=Methanolinea mesophila TaxID=547055 RepID=UPI001AE50A44|nr:radical SAM protein [Methanolinea mesophila]MBP1928353.1 radical SAM superfamily enzyme YgiQ (UPF0313 family) [Methanolinea mesophila]
MEILLVNPPRLDERIPVIREDRCEITDRYAIIPPYSLLQMASILREKGHLVHLIDANGENITYSQVRERISAINFDIIFFRFGPTTFDWDMRVSQISKELRPKAVTAGICYTVWSIQSEVMQQADNLDILVSNEWEQIIPRIVTSIGANTALEGITGICFRQNGKIVETSRIETVKEYGDLPLPAYDLIADFRNYRPNTPTNGNFTIIYTSKGCPFGCTYCTVARTPYHSKPANKVIEELLLLYNNYDVKLVTFFDETFTIDRKRTVTICEEISRKMPELRWYCNTRVNLVDDELLGIMHEAGCRGIAYGIESGCQNILDNVHKGITVEQARTAILLTKKNRIKVYTSFILGLPGETSETVAETFSFLKSTTPHGAQFNIAVPYPGTELLDYAIREGLISEYRWKELYQHQAMLKSETLTPEELEAFRKKAYRILYLNPMWVASNVRWVLENPEDLRLGIRYYLKALRNLFIHDMEHAH